MILGKYRLKKDLPDLKKGVIFEHREYDPKHPEWGSLGYGVMILGWLKGDCQGGHCGETYILPGDVWKHTEWFEEIDCSDECNIELRKKVKKLERKIEELEDIINSKRKPF